MSISPKDAYEKLQEIYAIENGLNEELPGVNRAMAFIMQALAFIEDDTRTKILEAVTLDHSLRDIRACVLTAFSEATKERVAELITTAGPEYFKEFLRD